MYLSNQELLSYHLSVSVSGSSVLLSLLNSPAYLLITTLATSHLRFPILLCILLFSVSTCVPLSVENVNNGVATVSSPLQQKAYCSNDKHRRARPVQQSQMHSNLTFT